MTDNIEKGFQPTGPEGPRRPPTGGSSIGPEDHASGIPKFGNALELAGWVFGLGCFAHVQMDSDYGKIIAAAVDKYAGYGVERERLVAALQREAHRADNAVLDRNVLREQAEWGQRFKGRVELLWATDSEFSRTEILGLIKESLNNQPGCSAATTQGDPMPTAPTETTFPHEARERVRAEYARRGLGEVKPEGADDDENDAILRNAMEVIEHLESDATALRNTIDFMRDRVRAAIEPR